MELRPLYLASGRAWRVVHDGEALRVEGDRRAPSWYPFRRLGRVVSATDVQWQSDALLACLAAGVPVCFVDGHGRPQGFCYGTRRRETTLSGLLAVALDSPDWQSRYGQFRAGMSRQFMLAAQRTLGVSLRKLHEEYARGRFCNAHALRLRQPVAPLLRSLEGNVVALVAERLAGELPSDFLGHPAPGMCFALDFAAILIWPAHSLVRHTKPRMLAELGPARAAAMLLERHCDVTDSMDELLYRFEHWLRGWVL